MKVLHLSTFDMSGGAARACLRLHRGLRAAGIDSTVLVQARTGDDPSVRGPKSLSEKLLARGAPTLDAVPLRFYPKRLQVPWSVGWLPRPDVRKEILEIKPDIINLHWIGSGFVPLRSLRDLGVPIVWTFHDMWPITGGCHYDGGCGGHARGCGRCPQLASDSNGDLSRKSWNARRDVYSGLSLSIVSPSRWMASLVRESPLLKDSSVTVIPYGLDLDVFRPIGRSLARQLLGLPTDRNLLLFAAVNPTSDPRKGFGHLRTALNDFAGTPLGAKTSVVIAGARGGATGEAFGLPLHWLGTLHDDIALALAYSAADACLVPSVQDNLPNIVVESMACGTPCVAFNTGGIPDMIDHELNGYLSPLADTHDFLNGIVWTLGAEDDRKRLSEASRQKAVSTFSLHKQAERYAALYSEILAADRGLSSFES